MNKILDRQLSHSQNFLRDPKLVAVLVKNSDIRTDNVVYEIGPGKGIITRELCKRCARVVAVEYDHKFFEKLKDDFRGQNKVEIVCGDFLRFQLPSQGKYKVFSNIPFDQTADILAKLISSPNPPVSAYLIVQEEAAKKHAGMPWGSEERLRSLLLKPYFELSLVHRFKRRDFCPVPRVSIVMLRIKKRKSLLVSVKDSDSYKDFTAYAFNQSGKDLRERLKKIFTSEQFKRLSRNLHFSYYARPGELKSGQWLGLFSYFLQGASENKRKLTRGAHAKWDIVQKGLDKIHRTRTNKKEE